MNIVDPGDTHVGSSDVEAASEKYSPLATAGARRPYSPPRLLSSEVLELAAAVCDGTGGFGKNTPPCNPATPGS